MKKKEIDIVYILMLYICDLNSCYTMNKVVLNLGILVLCDNVGVISAFSCTRIMIRKIPCSYSVCIQFAVGSDCSL